ncbi:MAG: UDP-N-acetylmuramoyl-L-alanyl-D-glutamate--2,6-diaminopimelate ligase, partial [Acidimicrobiales bacterium]
GGITLRAQDVRPGDLFAALPGSRFHGSTFAPDAIGAGAVAVLTDQDGRAALHALAERGHRIPVPVLVADAPRLLLGGIAKVLYGDPSTQLAVVGITGTAGKTTTCYLLEAALAADGSRTGLIGTVQTRIDGRVAPSALTTPEAPDLQALFAVMLERGVSVVAMEVSSHALAMERVAATRFAVAVFTNLSHDHLDFHRDLDDYFEAKAALFTARYSDGAVVNLDDAHGAELARRDTVPTEGFALEDARDLVVGATSCRFTWRGQEVVLALGGRFNVSNALAAATAAARLGIPEATIAAGLAQAPPVPGRFEPVDEGQPFAVLVDYAHKPGALEGALAAARGTAAGGRVIVVVGAGGDRDPSKRPEMGEVAGRLADRVILTSDNPRSEDPLDIIDAMRAGVPAGADVAVEPDRRRAIDQAVGEAEAGDVVVIAGKGHEATQIVGDRTIEHDDRLVAREALRALRGSGRW